MTIVEERLEVCDQWMCWCRDDDLFDPPRKVMRWSPDNPGQPFPRFQEES